MNKPVFNKRKTLIRVSILLIAVLLWVLGDVKRSYWIKDSPDGRFSTNLVANRGWRHTYSGGIFFIYVRDSKTDETVLAATHPENCVFEQITLNDIEWKNNSHSFTCLWAVQYNGVYKQHFDVASEPLRVHAGPPCCGAS